MIKRKGFTLYILLALIGSGCSLTQHKYEREYAKIWKEMIKSKAWQESFLANGENKELDLYASTETHAVLLDGSSTADFNNFEERYASLVSRAYFKIITEAEKADARISAEYRLLEEQQRSDAVKMDRSIKKRRELTVKKYNAHKAMLSGLKSWNIFSEDRSGDLDYFKAENRQEIQRMMINGEPSDTMVNFLIYKLADLYHVEE
ncbi:hypothetical protein [Maribacter sp. 2304DJ31-5]|uniref:hypothetical protein n=1 Tax=Maribacter sp. 2304DJ31-5 TaxID=3386273 RepID=UPI0039BCDD4E